jgi:hypothetical protein
MKQKKNLLLVLALLLGFFAFAFAAPDPDQPHMTEARADLQAAKAELQNAEHNKGGHRAKAVGYVNAAITAVDRGIEYARRHNHAQPASEAVAGSLVAPDQPHMRAALANLENAKRHLQEAEADKGGYRKQAIEDVNRAIDEVNKGIAAGS